MSEAGRKILISGGTRWWVSTLRCPPCMIPETDDVRCFRLLHPSGEAIDTVAMVRAAVAVGSMASIMAWGCNGYVMRACRLRHGGCVDHVMVGGTDYVMEFVPIAATCCRWMSTRRGTSSQRARPQPYAACWRLGLWMTAELGKSAYTLNAIVQLSALYLPLFF